MRHSIIFIFLILGATEIFIYSGCSSSSNSIRYKDKPKPNNTNDSPIRFSSEYGSVDTVSTNNPVADSDPDDIPDNERSVDISSIVQRFSTRASNTDMNADRSTLKEKMLMEIIKYLNTPYKWGGDTKKGIDCSAFTQKIYEETFTFQLERTAREQYREGESIDNIDDLKFGDLVFFNTRRWVRPGHVGIYIGDHLFAHSSASHGVIVSSIKDSYYSRRFMGGRRIENLFSSKNTTSGK